MPNSYWLNKQLQRNLLCCFKVSFTYPLNREGVRLVVYCFPTAGMHTAELDPPLGQRCHGECRVATPEKENVLSGHFEGWETVPGLRLTLSDFKTEMIANLLIEGHIFWVLICSEGFNLRPLASYITSWNECNELPMHRWLSAGIVDDEHESRLKICGNLVVPKCADLALQVLVRMHRVSWYAYDVCCRWFDVLCCQEGIGTR